MMIRFIRATLVAISLLIPSILAAADAGVPIAVKQIADAGAANQEPEPLAAAIPPERMPTFSLDVNPKSVSIGEVVHWRVTVKRRKEDRVHLGSSASFGGLEIKEKNKTEKAGDGEWVEETLDVGLIGFEAEDVVIPPQKLTAVDKDGNISELLTKEAHVTVKSLIANEPEPEIKEDTGPGETVMEEDYLLLWILGVLTAIALVALLTLIGRKLWAMRRPKPEPPPPPPRPAEEIAFEKLDALKGSNLLAEGEIKEFHVRLSETIREYLGNRYRFDSLELSSEELIVSLRKTNISKTEYNIVMDFLGETDLVKFAKVLPTMGESEDLLAQSFHLVERTTPKPIVTETKNNASSERDESEADHA